MLKREVSLGVGLATMALVYGVYQGAMPSVAEARATPAGDTTLASTERAATWTAGAVVAGVSLIARDPTVFILGGSALVIMAWWHRHANQHDPTQGAATLPSSRQVQSELMSDGAGYSPSLTSVG